MIITFIIYLVAVFIIGITAERFISKSEEGFYLGDRNFGAWVTAISAGATDSSGWVFIGAAGAAYLAGASTMWMLPGFIVGYFLNWFVFAPKLYDFGVKHNVLSLADYFEKRYNDQSHLLKVIASIIFVIFFVAYMASQLTAAGKALDVMMNLDFNTGLILCAAFVLGYSVFGGYRSVMMTDFVQGLLMVGVLIIFPIYMIFFELGGWTSFWQQAIAIDPILTTSTGGAAGSAAIGLVLGYLLFGFGVPGQPHISQRFLTAKDPKTLRDGSIIAMAWVIIMMTSSNLLGIIGRIIYPELKDPEYVFPILTMNEMSPIIAGIVIGAVFAAIQSTFSSQLMVATQAIASDLLKSISKNTYTDKQLLTISRWTMVFLGVISTGIALLNLEAVFYLVMYAWGGLAASFGPLLYLSLYTNLVTKQGAAAGMITGTLITIIWKNTPYSAYVYELIPAAVLATLAILIVSKITKNKNSELNESERNAKTF
ncbi:sodium/proline symporter [Metabacillus arenae]|uniref:Sodium/proline symporter n=1 Tax=Metabacillus arenae TaxID=2771434 RepID=A0A926NKA0_9BACI|nr:sodium/proline symporter [Metabacillus arenae]MBD1381518.1 sodium/proline symporter [Metabacillus arenae]